MGIACDNPCRVALAVAICGALDAHLPAFAADSVNRTSAAHFMTPVSSSPLLAARARLLHNEFGCAADTPPLAPKWVPNGKSAMSFLVSGGAGVDAQLPASYSVLLKQLNKREGALLPKFYSNLVQHCTSNGGTLIAKLLGQVRYISTAGGVFDAVMMENVARPPPGVVADAGSGWHSFDMKGIPLYSHEQRLKQQVGSEGLYIAPRRFEAMRGALASDVEFLKSWCTPSRVSSPSHPLYLG